MSARGGFSGARVGGLALLLSAHASIGAVAQPPHEPVELPGWVIDWVDTCSGAGSAATDPGTGDAFAAAIATESPAPPDCALWFLIRAPIDLTERIEQDRPVRRELRRASQAAPRSLVRLLPGGTSPRVFAADLDTEARLTAIDLDGLGALDPVVIGRGSLQRILLDDDDVLSLHSFELPVDGDPAVGLPASPQSLLDSLGPRAQLFAWPEVGRVHFFRLQRGPHPRFHAAAASPLPTKLDVASSVFELSSPSVRRIEPLDSKGTGPAFASEPILVGPGRWKVLLFDPTAERPEEQVRDAWLRTPEIERPIWSRFVSLNGEVLLVAQALRDDRVGMLERKKIRIFRLRPDRTRAGLEASFAEQTASRLWQELEVGLRADDLGVLTLDLLQRDGFDGKKTLVSRYVGTLSGLSRVRPRKVVLKAPWANWTSGHDLDGDGLEDLLLASDELQLHSGSGGGRTPFDRRSSWSAELPEAGDATIESTLELADEEARAEVDLERATGDDTREESSPEITWGTAHVIGPPAARTLMLLGARGRSARGGTHLVLQVAPPR